MKYCTENLGTSELNLGKKEMTTSENNYAYNTKQRKNIVCR